MATKEQKNAFYSDLLGWSPSSFGETGFTPALTSKVRKLQTKAQLDADGVCGPRTYSALLDAELLDLQAQARRAAAPARLEGAGRIALNRARRLWLSDIRDPRPGAPSESSRAQIDEFIRGKGGLHWTWEEPYHYDGDFEWCGAFCAHVWGLAGLIEDWRKTYYSSTYRLDRYARYLQVSDDPNPRPVQGGRCFLALSETSQPIEVEFATGEESDRDPRAGDILLVGPADKDYGSHICVVESYDPVSGVFWTFEGNGTGKGPGGSTQHGVVRGKRTVGLRPGQTRSHYHARRLLRPALADLTLSS